MNSRETTSFILTDVLENNAKSLHIIGVYRSSFHFNFKDAFVIEIATCVQSLTVA